MSNWLRVNNPTMKEEIFTQSSIATSVNPMTLSGTVAKTGLFLLSTVIFAAISYAVTAAQPGLGMIAAIAGAIGGIIVALIINFKRELAAPLGFVYTAFSGAFLGAISFIYAMQMKGTQYAGIVPMAIMGTLVVFGVMLVLYATRIIRVGQTFRTVVIGATMAVGIFYLGAFAASFVWPGAVSSLPVFTSGPIGIVFSLAMIVLAAMNLALDFDLVEQGVENRMPKQMEWFAAFGILVTLVWLYIEMLRLIRKLAGNR